MKRVADRCPASSPGSASPRKSGPACAVLQPPGTGGLRPAAILARLVRHGTYSITARDPHTGELGVAVHSHWFSVGPICAWARPGVGAVATQSVADPSYGPRGLDAMASGEPADAALAALLAADDAAAVRQVAMVDAAGRIGVHTGADCIPCAGHVAGDDFTCQANMMERDTVPSAMAEAFSRAAGDLSERMLQALEAAEAQGGDVRGRQSAVLLTVPAAGAPWESTVDLRVDDHREPLGELRRLLGLGRAYALAGRADELIAAGAFAEASELYERAARMAPDADELVFWAGLAIARRDLQGGVEKVRQAAAVNPNWLVLLDRLSPDFAPTGAEVRRALGR